MCGRLKESVIALLHLTIYTYVSTGSYWLCELLGMEWAWEVSFQNTINLVFIFISYFLRHIVDEQGPVAILHHCTAYTAKTLYVLWNPKMLGHMPKYINFCYKVLKRYCFTAYCQKWYKSPLVVQSCFSYAYDRVLLLCMQSVVYFNTITLSAIDSPLHIACHISIIL